MLNRNLWVASFVVAVLTITACSQQKEDTAPVNAETTATTAGNAVAEVGSEAASAANSAGSAAVAGAQTAGTAITDGATATAQDTTQLADDTKDTLNPATSATDVNVPADQQY